MATLEELRTIYTLEDARMMHEALYVPRYNEDLESKKAIGKIERGR